MTELLGVDELPHRAVVDLEAALGELSHEPAQGEVPLPAAPDQPVAMRAGDLLRLVTADLARRDAAGVATRFSQLIAVLSLTPKRAAACRRESPSCATAATTRSRRSIE